jgi:protocatechuate 3,4-dioxygenase beta subunit
MNIVVTIGLVTGLSLQTSSQVEPGQVRQAQSATETPRQGSHVGTVRGRAIEVDTKSPMRRVVVGCVSDRGPTAEVTTGADGRYELKNLSPGRCMLSARRSGYLASPARAQALSPQSIPIDLVAGETVENADFKLVRAGAISGRIIDEYGDAVVNARVTARRWVFDAEGRRLRVVAAADTDDLGEFRLSDLTAGSYHVAAVFPQTAARTVGTAGSYRVTPVYPPSAAMSVPGGLGSRDMPVSFAYYPGAPTAAQAQRIAVRERRDITGIDFILSAMRGASVSGTVLDVRGRPAIDAMVTLSGAGAGVGGAGVMATAARPVGGIALSGVIANAVSTPVRAPDGGFNFPWVWPGEYVLTAHTRVGRSLGVAFAAQSLNVDGGDAVNLNLVMIGGGEPLHGRIRTDGAPAEFTPDRLRVRLMSAENEDLVDRLGLPISGLVRPDWTFDVTRIPGLRLMRIDGLPADWAVKAVTLGTRTITDALLDLETAGSLPEVTIILTNHPTELSGEVLGPDDERISDYAVVAFASDQSRWAFAPRFIQVERPNQHGRFRIRGLAPGDYLLAAVESVDETEWRDPEFLSRLRPLATPVAVKEGASAPMTLLLIVGDRR